MDQLDVFPIVVRWIHIVAAIVAIGGAAFIRFVLLPSFHESLDDQTRQKLMGSVRQRWSKIVGLCIVILLATGAGNFVLLALRAGLKPMPYHALFGIKFIAAMVIFFLASALVGRSPGFAKMRERPARPLTVIVVLGVLIVLLSGTMNQIRHLPGAKKVAPSSITKQPS